MFQVRVLYADTDMAGVVYHANYLRYFEAARTDALYRVGVDLAQLHTEQGIVFAISDCSLQFHRSARYGDTLQIKVLVRKIGPARVTLGYEVRCNGGDELYVTGETTFAALDAASGRVVRLPGAMRDGLQQALEAAL
ncbi:MAG: acyl-CoA thioesterase [Armatimonadetes bacterium]|nr:acyl-CoA thioesterase [Armatimonadota bacterium]